MAGIGEVVIEIKASGLCGSDLHFYHYRAAPGVNRHPRVASPSGRIIAGHEPCGVVAEVGPSVDPALASVGDRVMVHHYWGCTRCRHCRIGWPQMCETQMPRMYGMTDHGAHAPFLKVPAATVIPMPEDLSFLAGAAISCSAGTAFEALMRVNPSGKDTIAVFGQGPVGLATSQIAAGLGARVIALDVNPERLELAKRIGADVVLNPDKIDAAEALRDLTGGRGADYVIETSGVSSARSEGIDALRPWGKILLLAGGSALEFGDVDLITTRQIGIEGSWTFSSVSQAECARFVVEKNIHLDALYTHTWSIEQAAEGYERFAKQTDGKAALVF
ncbi:zinc-binding dehydrogenase (plasmid) [Arthrobacter sp. zg-Y820]|nr:zinc-binding dehydrogenase [Arthrobacter sp. zg-Y820]WIB11274.1 zinc-binding dehydrogenase [Arthrobacter sp. zg-Y820]